VYIYIYIDIHIDIDRESWLLTRLRERVGEENKSLVWGGVFDMLTPIGKHVHCAFGVLDDVF